MAILTSGSLFPAEVVKSIFFKVKGHSSLVKLSEQTPISFSGSDIMTFSMDDEVAIVAEGGEKPAGDAKMGKVTIAPIKIVYQARVSDEFVHCAEEKQLDYLSAYVDGASKKVARGLDLMAMHGVDPKTNKVSALIGKNSFDTADVNAVALTAGQEEDAITSAVEAIGDYDVTGLAMSKPFATALSKVERKGGQRPYEDLAWGGNPDAVRGIPSDVNSTVGSAEKAYVGDFETAFKWGYADEMPLEIIEYGDPDGQGDLKRTNQVLLRTEMYIGWGILDPKAFAKIEASA